MTNQEIMALLEKAAITTQVATTVSAEDASEFIDLALEQVSVLNKFQVERNITTGRKLSTLELGEPVTHEDVENTDPEAGEVITPTFGEKQLTPAGVRLDYDVTFDMIRENIEGEGINETLNMLFSKRHGKDMVMMAFRGDTTLADDTRTNKALRAFDGINKQAADSSNTHILNTGTSTSLTDTDDLAGEVFSEMLKLLPEDYKDPEGLAFEVSWDDYYRYLDQISARGTELGDRALTGQWQPNYNGIPVVPLFKQVSTHRILTPLKNVAIGWGREWEKGQDVYNRAGRIEITIRTGVDAKIVLDDALVMAYPVD